MTLYFNSIACVLQALRGSSVPKVDTPGFVNTPYQSSLLAELLQSHCTQDLCLVGPRGSGKSMTVQRLSDMLAYETEPIVLFQVSIHIYFHTLILSYLCNCCVIRI